VSTDEQTNGTAVEISTEQLEKTTAESQAEIKSGDILGKYVSDDEYRKAYDGMILIINEWEQIAHNSNDWKALRSRQAELRSQIKVLFLNKEDDKALNEKIDNIADVINQKQNEERSEKDKISTENYEIYKPKVDEASQRALDIEKFAEARDVLLKLQSELRNVHLKRSQKDELLNTLQETFFKLNEKQAAERENYEMECIDNYHQLKGIIEEACKFAEETTQFVEARQKLINLQQEIRGRKLKKDQRDELYKTIRDSFEILNKRQSADRETSDEEIKENYDKMKKIVDDAIEFSKNTEDYGDARARLIASQGEIKGIRLRREQRDELFAQIREVFTALNEKQSSERSEFEAETMKNYEMVNLKVNDLFELVLGVSDFKLIRETLMNLQAEIRLLKLKREHRTELFSKVREAFNIFDKKRGEFFTARKEDRMKKINMLRNNIVTKLERVEELKAKDSEAFNTANEAETKDEQLIANLSSRLKEKNDRIDELKVKLADIEKDAAKIEKEGENAEHHQEVISNSEEVN